MLVPDHTGRAGGKLLSKGRRKIKEVAKLKSVLELVVKNNTVEKFRGST